MTSTLKHILYVSLTKFPFSIREQQSYHTNTQEKPDFSKWVSPQKCSLAHIPRLSEIYNYSQKAKILS